MILGPTYRDVEIVAGRALELRARLNLSYVDNLRIVEFLELEIPRKIYRDFALIVGTDDRFREALLAYSTPKPPRIFVRERIYRDAMHGDFFARHTLAHELGHIYLCHSARHEEIKWGHQFTSNLEWEANEFAWELLMPSAAIQMMTASEISSTFYIPQKYVGVRFELLRSRRLKEAFTANSLVNEPLNSQLYHSRPKYLDRLFANQRN
jgi:hypothetical protein